MLPVLPPTPRAVSAPHSPRKVYAKVVHQTTPVPLAYANPYLERAVTAPEGASRKSKNLARTLDNASSPQSARPTTSHSSRVRGELVVRSSCAGSSDGSRTVALVREWWAPVDKAVRAKQPMELEKALKVANGVSHLKVIRSVRHATSLSATDRHMFEAEIAARLVGAKALLGKWQASMHEVRAAQKNRCLEALQTALDRWQFSDADPEVSAAQTELARWKHLSGSLPRVYREGLQRRDIAQLQEALDELVNRGPAAVELSDQAQKLVKKYNVQVRALDTAVRAGNGREIQLAISGWEFCDSHESYLRAQQALDIRAKQKKDLRFAVASKDSERMRTASDAWNFERNDQDFSAVVTCLERCAAAVLHLERLTQGHPDMPGLVKALQAWAFTKEDARFLKANGVLETHETAMRDAITFRDGWELHRRWLLSGGVTGLKSADLKEEAIATLQRYSKTKTSMRSAMSVVADSTMVGDYSRDLPGSKSRLHFSDMVSQWSFARSDPIFEAASAFMRCSRQLEKRYSSVLASAVRSRSVPVMINAVERLHASGFHCEQVEEAQKACAALDKSLESVGMLSLGIKASALQVATERRKVLHETALSVRETVANMDPDSITPFRLMAKPSRVVHGVFEILIHVLSGIHPSISLPPRDTDWKCCQRLALQAASVVVAMDSVPDWVSSGHIAGVSKARFLSQALTREVGDQWRWEELQAHSASLAQISRFLDMTFAHLRALESFGDPLRARGTAADNIVSSTMLKKPSAKLGKPKSAQRAHGVDKIQKEDQLPDEEEFAHQDLLPLLGEAGQCLVSSLPAAAAWIIQGGDPEVLRKALEPIKTHAVESFAISVASRHVLRTIVEAPVLLPTDQGNRNLDPHRGNCMIATVKFISGEVVAEVVVGVKATVEALKVEIAQRSGIPAAQQKLLYGAKVLENESVLEDEGVNDTATILLIKTCVSMLDRLQLAQAAITRGIPDTEGPMKQQALEPVRALLYGLDGAQQMPAKRKSLECVLREVVRACCEQVKGYDAEESYVPLAVRRRLISGELPFILESVQLTPKTIRSCRLPLMNVSCAWRELAFAKHTHPTLVEVLNTLLAYFSEFVPQRIVACSASIFSQEANMALQEATRLVEIATSLADATTQPPCASVADVQTVAESAAEQVYKLALESVALPAVHVEYVRKAVDAVGAALIDKPPAGDPGGRLTWVETAVAIQLAPMTAFQKTLQRIADAIDMNDLLTLVNAPCAESTEVTTLLSAMMWILRPDCKADASLKQVRKVMFDNPESVRKALVEWDLLRDAAVDRSMRAWDLLKEIWPWIVRGCNGHTATALLCSWVSLIVTLTPMLGMAQRLVPVHQEMKKACSRIQKAEPRQVGAVMAKAWTSAIFVLDASGSPWWWLGLIRTSVGMAPPWLDDADGGVGVSPLYVEEEA